MATLVVQAETISALIEAIKCIHKVSPQFSKCFETFSSRNLPVQLHYSSIFLCANGLMEKLTEYNTKATEYKGILASHFDPPCTINYVKVSIRQGARL